MDTLSSLVRVGVYDMKIKSVKIKGIARIENELYLEFKEGMNIICGINGTCKTTILECIAHFFSPGQATELKKNVNAAIGECTIITDQASSSHTIGGFAPEPQYARQTMSGGAIENTCFEILYFKTRRDFAYSNLNAIPRDIVRSNANSGQIAVQGVPFAEFKGWFFNRYFSAKEPSDLSPEQLSNFNTAKECFNILDKNIYFSKAKTDTYDIMLHTKQGEIYFEYLSAGYKSCLYILMGIIKEIEFRFKPVVDVKDFGGVILIDEIDLHLHPIWQATIVKVLKKTFPKAQIIMTTHSPHIVQSAEASEIIPLVIDSNNDIVVKKMEVNEYGYQGWTLEEILLDVMGMETTNSELYTKTINAFDKALNDEDDRAATENYNVLKKMLHPDSYMRKVLEIQMAGVEKDVD